MHPARPEHIHMLSARLHAVAHSRRLHCIRACNEAGCSPQATCQLFANPQAEHPRRVLMTMRL